MQTVHRQDSYYEEYKRTHHDKENSRNNNNKYDKLMTDRSSYMAFLEVELERVSSACMTVQAYKERISEINNNYNELEDKLKQYSRALKLSSTIMDRRDHETNHKFDTLEARLHTMERKQTQISTDCAMFLNSDMPAIYDEVKQIVKKQMIGITEKYANVEKRCNTMIHERLEGYTDVYNALETKVNALINENLSKYTHKIKQNNEEIKEWTKNYMKSYSNANVNGIQQINEHIKNVQNGLNERIKNLEYQLLNQQPKYIKNFIKENVESIVKENNQKHKIRQNAHDKSAQRAELTCSKIADDVYKRLQNQRCDLFKHIKNVENRISHQLKETINHISDQQKASTTQKRARRSRSMTDRKLLSFEEKEDLEQINLNMLKNQILDYRSEMIHSQQKLEDLENTFSQKLHTLQQQQQESSKENDESICNVQNEQKLAELDGKYSEIQRSIGNLQQMIKNEVCNKSKSTKKCAKFSNRKKKKNASKNMRSSLFAESTSVSDCSSPIPLQTMPTHLTPHLSDLDNLVQCVMATDKIDRRHTKNADKEKRSSQANKKKYSKKKRVRKTSCPVSTRKPLWT